MAAAVRSTESRSERSISMTRPRPGAIDAATDLDAPGKNGAILAAIVIPVLTGFDCIPAD